jgi:MFS family permease
MGNVLRRPGVLRLLATNIASRLPLAAVDVVLIVHVHAVRGSWALAGLVGGLHGLAAAAAAPALGALVDRRGQTLVLLPSGLASGAALAGLAAVPPAAPVAALGALAVVAGLTQPPLGACLRTLWPVLMAGDASAMQAAYALESAVLELTFIAGPPVFLAIAAVSSRVAIGLIGVVLAVGTVAFAAEPASRAWRPSPGAAGALGALRNGGVRTLTAVMALVGLLLGAVEVAVAAAMTAAHTPGATGPLLALWGAGSLVGGLVAARAGRPPDARSVAALLVALGLGHAALAVASSPVVLGAVLLVAGAAVAPLFAAANTLAARVAYPGTSTEAFAWLNTAVAAGVAIGALVGGALADGAGPRPAFVAAAGAAGLGAALAGRRGASLRPLS